MKQQRKMRDVCAGGWGGGALVLSSRYRLHPVQRLEMHGVTYRVTAVACTKLDPPYE